MRKNALIKAWLAWYGRNSSRFPFRVRIEKMKKPRCRYRLKFYGIGIAYQLSFTMDSSDVTCWVMHEKECWDMFILADSPDIKTTATGYYCNLCKENKPENFQVYASQAQLWAEHCFEPMLEWMNKNFTLDRWVCIFSLGEGSATWAKISSKEEMEQMRLDKEFVHAFPILQPAK